MDLVRFDPYQSFQFIYKNLTLDSLKRRLEGKNRTLCYVGYSHSRVLAAHSLGLGIPNVAIDWPVKPAYSKQLTEEIIASIINTNCTKVVLGLGQWDAGHPEKKPTSFLDYEQNWLKLVKIFQKMIKEADSDMDLFVRSTQ